MCKITCIINVLFYGGLIWVESLRDNIVDKRETFSDVFRRPITEKWVEQPLVTTWWHRRVNDELLHKNEDFYSFSISLLVEQEHFVRNE